MRASLMQALQAAAAAGPRPELGVPVLKMLLQGAPMCYWEGQLHRRTEEGGHRSKEAGPHACMEVEVRSTPAGEQPTDPVLWSPVDSEPSAGQ